MVGDEYWCLLQVFCCLGNGFTKSFLAVVGQDGFGHAHGLPGAFRRGHQEHAADAEAQTRRDQQGERVILGSVVVGDVGENPGVQEENYGTTMGQLWDDYGTTMGQL